MAVFYPCTNNMLEAKLKINELISLVEISRIPLCNVVINNYFMQVYNEKEKTR